MLLISSIFRSLRLGGGSRSLQLGGWEMTFVSLVVFHSSFPFTLLRLLFFVCFLGRRSPLSGEAPFGPLALGSLPVSSSQLGFRDSSCSLLRSIPAPAFSPRGGVDRLQWEETWKFVSLSCSVFCSVLLYYHCFVFVLLIQ